LQKENINMTIILNGTTGVTFPDGTTQTDGLSTPVPIADGGTGQTTRQAAMDALAGAVTSGSYLRGDGTDVIMDTLKAADMTGAIAIANGGTGQTTATAAFNALNPMTTTGDIIYEASATTAARLAIGTTGQVLTVASGIPSWATISTTPTTDQVLTATAGLTAGAVGSYVFANRVTNSALAYNATVAGSDLRPSGAIQFSDINAQSSGTALAGTWRLLGNINDGSGFTLQTAIRSLFIRIS
jgi:hypothetical protein